MVDSTQYVKFSDYQTLKDKYVLARKKNKELDQLMKSMIVSIEIIKTTYDSIINISNSIPKIDEIKTLISKPHTNNNSTKLKEEFETKTESEMIENKFSPTPEANNRAINLQNNNLNFNNIITVNIVKKIEDSEVRINEMTRQYDNLVLKYKYLQEDKDLTDSNCKKYIDESNDLNDRITGVMIENSNLHTLILKQKELEKCLLNSINDTLLLNEKYTEKVERNDNLNCEPLPSFIKFMNVKII